MRDTVGMAASSIEGNEAIEKLNRQSVYYDQQLDDVEVGEQLGGVGGAPVLPLFDDDCLAVVA